MKVARLLLNPVCCFLLLGFIASCATFKPRDDFPAFVREIRRENNDFAFLLLSSYVREHPDSQHTSELRFALAEYYFGIKNYSDAIDELQYCIQSTPPEKNAVFAYAILYKIISENQNDPETLQKLKDKFFSKSLFLIFSDSKIKSYTSILNNRYDIVDYVDKIEVFKNNEAFLQVSP